VAGSRSRRLRASEGVERALVEGRHLGLRKSTSLTRRRGMKSWRRAALRREHVVREGVRGRKFLLARGRQRRARGARPEGSIDSRASRIGERPHSPDRRTREPFDQSSWGAVKRVHEPSSPRALACGVWSLRESGFLHSASLDSSGARVSELVAEIGEDHLPRVVERAAKRSRFSR